MKKIVLLLAIAVATLTSCTSSKYTMSDTEIEEKGYTTNKFDILKNGVVIAKITSHEFELYNNKLVKELSITINSISQTSDIEDIIKYVHTRFPDAKIEVNYDAIVKYE
jgi:hypothetical protein